MIHHRILTPFLLALGSCALLAQNPGTPTKQPTPPAAPPAEAVDMDAVSYIIGAGLGEKIRVNNVEPNMDALITGLKDAAAGKNPKYSPQEQQKIMTAFQNDLRGKAEKKRAELAAKNAKFSAEFLAKNGKKEGVITTPSGLQYQIMKEGSGPKPTSADKVKAIYKGQLINGTVFDDSKGQPREFRVGGVVKGWQEALPLMATGSKWKLFVPPALGYGPMQRGPVIEPNSVLVFEIELVEISKPASAVSPPIGIPGKPAPVKPGSPARKPATAVSPPIGIPGKPAPAKPGSPARKPATAVSPPIGIPGKPAPAKPGSPARKPATAVSPPIGIPGKPAPAKPGSPARKPATAVSPPIGISPLKKEEGKAPKPVEKKP